MKIRLNGSKWLTEFLCIGMLLLLMASCRKEKVSKSGVDESDPSLEYNVEVSIDLNTQSQKIKNIFSDEASWDFHDEWMTRADHQPSDFFSLQYPHVKNILFMTATGGSIGRDLLKEPDNRSDLKDYNFTDIVKALHNVIKQGLKPRIITGNVPLKYSENPTIGVFGVNVRPPSDYEVYYDYMKALGEALVQEFGINEVKTWQWGVLTEYENKDWFLADDEKSESTKIAYFKLYDYTVAALQDAIGPDNLFIGAHSMTSAQGLWDEHEFISHVAKGINYKTGKTGTQIDFLSASFYDKSPGVPSPNPTHIDLKECINSLRSQAQANGLNGLYYGIDEGRIIQGPPDDKRQLPWRAIALSFQGASDARMFKTMTDIDADWFAFWEKGATPDGVWGEIPTVSTHIAALGYKMAGENRVRLSASGNNLNDKNDEVDGLGSIDGAKNVMHLMVYNYNDDMNATSKENVLIEINHIAPVTGSEVEVKKWIIDDNHGNFWPAWSLDMKKRGLSNADFGSSIYSPSVPDNLLYESDRYFWSLKKEEYKKLAKLDSTVETKSIVDNKLTLNATMDHHAVIFYEISKVKNSQ